jgi:hypothetical protein
MSRLTGLRSEALAALGVDDEHRLDASFFKHLVIDIFIDMIILVINLLK